MTHLFKLSFLAALPLTLGACGSMLLDLNGKAGSTSAPSASENAPSSEESASGSGYAADAEGVSAVDNFAGLTDEKNKEHARELKHHLREGMYRFTKDGATFARVESICGTKIWDKCEVVALDKRNEIGWHAYSFRVRGNDKIYRLPEMVYDIASPVWSARVWESIAATQQETRQELLTMLKDRCGHPVDSKCTVRELDMGDKFLLTVNKSSEEIHVPDTINLWRQDL